MNMDNKKKHSFESNKCTKVMKYNPNNVQVLLKKLDLTLDRNSFYKLLLLKSIGVISKAGDTISAEPIPSTSYADAHLRHCTCIRHRQTNTQTDRLNL